MGVFVCYLLEAHIAIRRKRADAVAERVALKYLWEVISSNLHWDLTVHGCRAAR